MADLVLKPDHPEGIAKEIKMESQAPQVVHEEFLRILEVTNSCVSDITWGGGLSTGGNRLRQQLGEH